MDRIAERLRAMRERREARRASKAERAQKKAQAEQRRREYIRADLEHIGRR